MQKSRYRLTAALMVLVLAAGCNGAITAPMQSEGTLSADLADGTEFLAQSGTTYSITGSGSNYFIQSRDNVSSEVDNYWDNISITVPIESSVPYSVNSLTDITPEVSYTKYNGNTTFTGGGAIGSCSITITQTSPTLIGSFHATTVSSAGDTIALSNGSFNATQQ